MIWWLAFEKKPFQFWQEIWIQVVVILLQLQIVFCWYKPLYLIEKQNKEYFVIQNSWKHVMNYTKVFLCKIGSPQIVNTIVFFAHNRFGFEKSGYVVEGYKN